MNTISRFDTSGLQPSTLNPQPSTKPDRRPTKLLKFPGLSVSIPYQEYRDGGRRYFTLFYHQAGRRIRENRATFAKLKQRAEQIATDIANGQAEMSTFTEADRARWLAVQEHCARAGIAPETGAALLADLAAQLAAQDPQPSTFNPQHALQAAIRFYLENRPRGFAPKPMPDLVEAFLTEKDGQISKDYHAHLARQLRLLAAHYTGPLHSMQATDINAWLRTLDVGPRARHNYRAAVDQLARWAQTLGYLPRAWAEMEHVPDPGQKTGEIKILTPEQMTALITARQQAEETGRASGTMVPFLALQAWAGIRHEEVTKLDWRNVNLDKRHVYISKGIAKTGADRIIPISDNLAAWLSTYAKRNGRVCSMANPSNALTVAKRKARIPSGDNETKNVLRKSFISYRLAVIKSIAQVAEEAGNSPGIIKKHYGRPLPETEGARWFDIWPTAAEVLQLNFNLA